ncbi:MAG: DUF177 domain-containing protein [Deltaproteobacteria bacterium]|nr:DUF177 domain-containing protein [Deltaproteobacteria bacterium]
MKILVDRLKATPERYTFEAEPGWWQEVGPSLGILPEAVLDTFRLEMQAYTLGEELFFDGEVKGALELSCSRCLVGYREEIRESFRLLLEPVGDRLPAEPAAAAMLAAEGMCLSDELGTGWYKGAEVTLNEFFREVLALALPAKPLCRDECLGLCPQCGVDRNTEPCTCTKTNPLSPFAVLGSLRKD